MNTLLTYIYKQEHGRNFIIKYERPTKCPFCGAGIANNPVYEGNFEITPGEKGLFFTVTECHACRTPFVSVYLENKDDGIFRIVSEYPKEKKLEEFSKHITKTYPDFVSFYHQAQKAEQYELKDICGVGYRKALEFLVKTYLIKTKQKDEALIEKTSLGDCIAMIENPELKKCAQNAARLGNDHTHYKQKYQNRDINDLKRMVRIVVLWIDLEHNANTPL
jgi:hypothetical protein